VPSRRSSKRPPWPVHVEARPSSLGTTYTTSIRGLLFRTGLDSYPSTVRTGHCRLNQYLSRIGIVEEAKCLCGTDDETVCHVLCVCPLWATQWKTLQAIAGDRLGDVSYLLGGRGKCRDARSGKLLDGEKDNWTLDLTVVKATVQYLQETGQLTYPPEEGQVG
jgi:hypothetical protein